MPQSPRDLPLVLDAPEVAELLGVSCDLVYDSARRGELPSLRLGRRLKFSTAAILALLEPCATQEQDA